MIDFFEWFRDFFEWFREMLAESLLERERFDKRPVEEIIVAQKNA